MLTSSHLGAWRAAQHLLHIEAGLEQARETVTDAARRPRAAVETALDHRGLQLLAVYFSWLKAAARSPGKSKSLIGIATLTPEPSTR